jgi:hypothetical protein
MLPSGERAGLKVLVDVATTERRRPSVARRSHRFGRPWNSGRGRHDRRVRLHRLECGANFRRPLVAALGLLDEAALNNAPQHRRHRGGQRRRRLAQDGGGEVVLAPAGKGQIAGSQLVKHHAERPDIAALVVLPAEQDLWCHVGERAGQLAGLDVGTRACRFIGVGRIGPARQPEVEDLGPAVGRDDDVGRLEVAVNDAVPVRVDEGVGNLEAVTDDRLGGETAVRDQLRQRLAVDELHRDERSPVRRADLVDRADVRMVERRGGARLSQEAGLVGGVRIGTGVDELDGDQAVQTLVVGPVDHAHAAGAEAGLDPVVAERLANHGAFCNWPLLPAPDRKRSPSRPTRSRA